MNCPTCSTPNLDGNRFCLKCGNPIPVSTTQPPSPPQNPGFQNQTASPVRTMRPLGNPPASPQPSTQQPNFNVPPSSAPQTVRMPDNYQVPPTPPSATPQYAPQSAQPQYAPTNNPTPQYPQQYGRQPTSSFSSSQGTSSMLNIWGPFAGYGARRRHIGWLMDNQAGRYQDLLNQVEKRLRERQIPGVDINWETLTARGLIVENRPYFIIKRGLVSLGLNIGAFGRDLFISMATYLKPPISNFRVLLLGGSILFAILGGPVINWMISLALGSVQSQIMGSMGGLFGGGNTNSGFDFSGLLIPVLCVIGPIWTINWLALQLGTIYSIYKYLTEKDLFSILRVAPNEFNEDDLMALEKAVEQTVRSGLDDIGLNPADLRPAAVQGNEQRLI